MKDRDYTLDYLRGVASLLVCVCHFSIALPLAAREIAMLGELGVQVFFVISGYIIPYSLARSGYRIANIGQFWLKRLYRLQPALMIALFFTFLVSQAAAYAKGEQSAFTLLQLASASLYRWIPPENPVVWTLIVEMKYYLFISLAFPLLFSRETWLRRLSFALCGAASIFLLPSLDALRYLPYFLIGFAACYRRLSLADRNECSLFALLAAGLAAYASGPWEIAAGIFAYLTILYTPQFKWRAGAWLGAISYSLYLLHFPLGVKLLNLSMPRVPEQLHLALFALAMGISLTAAHVFFKLFEEPSSRWSQQVRFKKPAVAPPATELEPEAANR